ncbi:hypothetical protein KUTeg_007514 [Tegillarca granosa]|uniref:MULE transposase domain-containing protein n=1 Tax=Tegillarca granosa TaxID=220873 RepID=A0ABQ9FDH5_TEGGR|nr:hypothetical protein KUTeg_007514 [Tegillarca granosa]
MYKKHDLARSGDDMKQLPGIYVPMPRKRKKDYKQVFARIFELMPSPPVTELLVGDFEEGMWRAAKSVLRGGCAFHWGQAVWRHVQELGLQICLFMYYITINDCQNGLQPAGWCIQVREAAACPAISARGTDPRCVQHTEGDHHQRATDTADQLHREDLDQRRHLDTIIVDRLPYGCEDKQRRRRMAPPHQQESPEVQPVLLCACDSSLQGNRQHPEPTKMISEGKPRR